MSERQVEVHMEGCWIPAELKNIRKGELFRMFESDGTPVTGEDGETTVFRATSDSYFSSKAAAWTVAIE